MHQPESPPIVPNDLRAYSASRTNERNECTLYSPSAAAVLRSRRTDVCFRYSPADGGEMEKKFGTVIVMTWIDCRRTRGSDRSAVLAEF